jgi:hypothetical protein
VTSSGFVFTESPTVRIDLVTTPDSVGTTYGDCELLGAVSVPGAAAAPEATEAMIPTIARTNSFFTLSSLFDRPTTCGRFR